MVSIHGRVYPPWDGLSTHGLTDIHGWITLRSVERFTTFLNDWLGRQGWSASRLARESGIPQNVISRWTSNTPTRPSPANLAKLAPVLGVSHTELMRVCGYIGGEDGDITETERRVSAELEERILRFQRLVDRGYPMGTLLAVLDANERMAAAALVPEPPLKGPNGSPDKAESSALSGDGEGPAEALRAPSVRQRRLVVAGRDPLIGSVSELCLDTGRDARPAA